MAKGIYGLISTTLKPKAMRTGLKVATAGYVGFKVTKGAYNWRNGVTQGMFTGSNMPAGSGKFGIRTNASSQPAGMSGIKFNFKRNK